jgi:Flp pilus assembly protein TadG
MLWDVFGNRRGSISVLSALAIFAVIGFSALALEFGHGLLRRVENQRIADIAAYGGALVFNSTSSTTTAGSAAQNLASLNGLTSSAANPSVVNSPTGDGNQAVQVTVTTSDPLLLAAVLDPVSQRNFLCGAQGQRSGLYHRAEQQRHRRDGQRWRDRVGAQLRRRLKQHGDGACL